MRHSERLLQLDERLAVILSKLLPPNITGINLNYCSHKGLWILSVFLHLCDLMKWKWTDLADAHPCIGTCKWEMILSRKFVFHTHEPQGRTRNPFRWKRWRRKILCCSIHPVFLWLPVSAAIVARHTTSESSTTLYSASNSFLTEPSLSLVLLGAPSSEKLDMEKHSSEC